jgi:hypothetical protein
MHTLDFAAMKILKDFLADRPEYAFLVFVLMVVVILWRAYRKAENEKHEITLQIIPMVEKLTKLLQRVSEQRRNSKKDFPAVIAKTSDIPNDFEI